MSNCVYKISNKFPWKWILAKKQVNKKMVYPVHWTFSSNEHKSGEYLKLYVTCSTDNSTKLGVPGC